MRIHVVHHACAGQERAGSPDADNRPLDRVGQRQAEAVASSFIDERPRRLLASPAISCIETLEPLARLTGLPIGTCQHLGLSNNIDGLSHLIMHPSTDGSVLCTHGELMRPLLRWLRRLDVAVHAEDTSESALARPGSVWAIEITSGPDAALRHVTLEHLSPSWAGEFGLHHDGPVQHRRGQSAAS